MSKPYSLKWRRWAVILLAALVYRNFRIWSQFVNPPTMPPELSTVGNCTTIHHPSERFKFCEDVSEWKFIRSAGGDTTGMTDSRLVVSCDPGRKQWNTVMGPLRNPAPRGDLWVFNPHPSLEPGFPKKVVLDNFPTHADFHPLGVHAIQVAPGKESHMFVVNHQRHRTTVEFFVLPLPVLGEEAVLARHVKTLEHPKFVSPNAVAPVSPSSFYVTNDHRMTKRLPSLAGEVLPLVETLFAIPLGFVDRVDLDLSKWHETGSPDDISFEVTRAISGIPFPNGVTVSPDKQELAIASSTKMEVYLYHLNQTELTLHSTVEVPFYGDNLSYGSGRALYVAGHPSFIPLVKIAKGGKGTSPSWVVRVTPKVQNTNGVDDEPAVHDKSGTHDVETLYQSDGQGGFATSTTAVFDEKERKLFVVGLYETGMLSCGP